MCGVWGSWRPADVSVVEDFSPSEKLYRRGPDERTLELYPQFALSLFHARLAIQGISGNVGRQPMTSRSSRFICVFNGEIFNFRELAELYSIDCKGSDTRLLVELLELLGVEKALSIIDGMFAIAVFDTINKNLCLARDTKGEKPLYYCVNDQSITFSSTLLDVSSVKKLSTCWIENFLTYGGSFDNTTVYTGIFKVMPGEVLHFTFDEGVIKKRQTKISYNDVGREFNSLAGQVISDYTSCDVELACLLSGGADSNFILSQSKKYQKIKSYHVQFHDGDPETKVVKNNLERGVINDVSIFEVEDQSRLEVLRSVIEKIDQPNCDPSLIPYYEVLSVINQNGFKVLLTGDGGDELFYGYKRHQSFFVIWFIFNSIIRFFGLTRVNNYFRQKSENKYVRAFLSTTVEGYFFSFFEIPKLAKTLQFPRKKFQNKFSSALTELIKLERSFFLENYVLRKVDEVSMYYGIETRAPLLSNRLIHSRNNLDLLDYMKHVGKKFIKKQLRKDGFRVLKFKGGFTPKWEAITKSYPAKILLDTVYEKVPNVLDDLGGLLVVQDLVQANILFKYRMLVLSFWLNANEVDK